MPGSKRVLGPKSLPRNVRHTGSGSGLRPDTLRRGSSGGAGGGAPTPQDAPRRLGPTLLASALGFVVAASVTGAVAWSSGCGSEAPPGASADAPARTSSLPAPARTGAPSAGAVANGAAPAPQTPNAKTDDTYTGPLLGALGQQTSIYPDPSFDHDRIGYIRLGGKVPVDPTPVKNASCPKGWFRLLDGGYVCGKNATLDLKDSRVRLGVTPPNLDDLLPYKYAYNAAHGTPLYRSVPSKEEMLKYEPYLADKKKKKKSTDDGDSDTGSTEPASSATREGADPATDKASAVAAAAAVGVVDGGAPTDEAQKPWWQAVEPGKAPNVTLAELEQESDSTIAKRMVKGFFIAVDKTFGWNDRLWYKTTEGLVAPTDRMYLVKAPPSQGLEIPEGVTQVGFIVGSKALKYDVDADKKRAAPNGSVARFTPFGLTGVTATIGGTVYRQTTDGWWMKGADGTYTEPGPPPADLAPGEKWIDVNLTRKTLVAFEGNKPVYAAVVSPGKKSKIKEKDHSTIQGTFRIREKHIAVTMDGDGVVAGDLPYSIQDVPYVEYFEASYALHGAFWHNNFGHDMSHGCVNLSPLDAKHLFFWSEPRLPRGWHAVWATPDHRGTLVVIHE